MLDQKELKEIFDYNPSTGVVVRKKRTSNNVRVGDVINTKSGNGYLLGSFKGKQHGLHRIIWTMVHGAIPDGLGIDHINGDRHDNRVVNLRNVTQHENCKNCVKAKNNTTGVTGVYFRKDTSKWSASIKFNYRKIHLGDFSNKEDAIKARLEAERNYGFHERHGKK